MAGDVGAAQSLLGIRNDGASDERSKASDEAVMTEEEIRALLLTAASSVPADSAAVARADSAGAEAGAGSEGQPKPRLWRSAGPRASEARGELPAVLYWKR
jgi:hypothetical protein